MGKSSQLSPFSKTVLLGLITAFIACEALLCLRIRLSAPIGKPEISASDAARKPPKLPPGSPPTNLVLSIEELMFKVTQARSPWKRTSTLRC